MHKTLPAHNPTLTDGQAGSLIDIRLPPIQSGLLLKFPSLPRQIPFPRIPLRNDTFHHLSFARRAFIAFREAANPTVRYALTDSDGEAQEIFEPSFRVLAIEIETYSQQALLVDDLVAVV